MIGWEGRSLPVALPGRALRRLAREHASTLYMTVLAGFFALLHRASGQRDVLVGSPIAGRHQAETEPLIGLFVNTLVIRSRLRGRPGFRGLLGTMRETTLDAYAHQDLPFEKLVAELSPRRTRSHSPIFQVMVGHQSAGPSARETLSGLTAQPLAADSVTAKFDLSLSLGESSDELRGGLSYRTDLFDAVTVQRLGAHLRNLFESVAADPERPLEETALVGAAERHQLVVEWNATESAEEGNLYDLMARWFARRPDAVALVGDRAVERRWSYGHLGRRVHSLAHRLSQLDVGPEVRVGLCLERSPEAVAALLAVLAAGGAYVPLDPEHPADRLSFLLTDSRATLLVSRRGQLPEGLVFPAARILWLEDLSDVSDMSAPSDSPGSAAMAYVIYTSGSTGKPKGVAVPHQGVVNTLAAARELMRTTTASRCLQAGFVYLRRLGTGDRQRLGERCQPLHGAPRDPAFRSGGRSAPLGRDHHGGRALVPGDPG